MDKIMPCPITHEYLLARVEGNFDERTWDWCDGTVEAVEAHAKDPVLVEAGWYAEAHSYGSEIHYEWAATRQEAAQEYVDEGTWPPGGDPWVDIYTYRRGYVYNRASGEVMEITIDRDRVRVQMPDADDDDEDEV